ncbi:MAG TPA: oligosaccharyl transferase, archaeosortase A system-associated [Methanospirillum sp.]|nr:oligosaccharyl transferase, archaeosortase A system-associated [Methanospirillum sp.]
MFFDRLIHRKDLLIILVILVFALFGLWLRLLPMEQLTSGPVQKLIFMDPWYSMRQIEVIAANLPAYPWFDPMNGYPVGKDIDWGPFYPVFSAFIAVILGATTRPGIITVASWIPPLLSLIMIPLIYCAGSRMLNKTAGVIGAILISVIAGEYLYRSFYGYIDHHLLEVIFSTGFMVLYFTLIQRIGKREGEEIWQDRYLLGLSVLAGLVYYLGTMNIPTIILFAGIIGIFGLFHACISRDENSLKQLSIIHGMIFGTFVILFAFTGIHESGFSLDRYTPIHIILAIALIIEPFILSLLVKYSRERPQWQLGGAIVAIPIALYILASLAAPAITSRISDSFAYFFFFSYESTFINEMQMWDFTRAFHSFNLALILAGIGLAVAAYQSYKRYNPVVVCALIWGVVILLSTILHLRYEYYAAVVVILFTGYVLSVFYDQIQEYFVVGKTSVKQKKGKQESVPSKNINRDLIPLVSIGLIILVITILSTQITWSVATEQLKIISMSDDWADSLVWMNQNSPEPGIDYLKIYDKQGFSYPDSAYGVLSWWDYGHWITYLAKRIPISSPFQNNVQEVAKFLIATDERDADLIANQTGARYIISDFSMITSKFPALPLWAVGKQAAERFQVSYYQASRNNPNQYDPVLTLKPDYFNTMIARLHIFDGSETNGTGANLVTYTDMTMNGRVIPTVSKISPLTPEQTTEALSKAKIPSTDIISTQYTRPVSTVTALHHYRLIYESPTTIAADEYQQIHDVKIFERVAGYTIAGTGTIELPLTTNAGRAFTYRQESSDGKFVVPYSTKRDGTGIKATGPYQIVGTGQIFEVSEEQVQGTA